MPSLWGGRQGHGLWVRARLGRVQLARRLCGALSCCTTACLPVWAGGCTVQAWTVQNSIDWGPLQHSTTACSRPCHPHTPRQLHSSSTMAKTEAKPKKVSCAAGQAAARGRLRPSCRHCLLAAGAACRYADPPSAQAVPVANTSTVPAGDQGCGQAQGGEEGQEGQGAWSRSNHPTLSI